MVFFIQIMIEYSQFYNIPFEQNIHTQVSKQHGIHANHYTRYHAVAR